IRKTLSTILDVFWLSARYSKRNESINTYARSVAILRNFFAKNAGQGMKVTLHSTPLMTHQGRFHGLRKVARGCACTLTSWHLMCCGLLNISPPHARTKIGTSTTVSV